ncbi:MAG: LAGLIDADG family homing endonuclease [Candidatus Paceibacterota bacterium]|jgi:hypothetical protein
MPILKKINKDFFKEWTSDMAYILGFLFADGNIVKTKRGTYFVAIYTADYQLLVSIVQSIGSDHKISERKSETGVVYRIQIGSKDLFNDLVEKGLTPNKSRRMKLPNVPAKYFNDFVRGYFDGDGNVWVGLHNKNRKKPTNVITASFTSASNCFLGDLHRQLINRGIKGGSLNVIKSKKCSRLSLSTLDALKLFTIMYTIPHSLFLNRKKLVFEKFINMRP